MLRMSQNLDSKKKYEALREDLIEYIKKNNLKHNDHLPTVRDIIATSGYSYATVNRTLIEMEKEGIIFKHQGKGLFVERIPNELSDKQFALIIPLDVNPHKIFMDILEGVKEILEKEAIGLLISMAAWPLPNWLFLVCATATILNRVKLSGALKSARTIP